MIEIITHHIVPAAMALLPPKMDSPRARALLLAIGLQESKFLHRHQIGGPARGFWQFEQGGGIVGVMKHPKTHEPLTTALLRLRYVEVIGRSEELHRIVGDNDVVACVCARLLLWSLPDALPDRFAPALAWEMYINGWRPGKPHRDTWNNYYTEAWERVTRTEVHE